MSFECKQRIELGLLSVLLFVLTSASSLSGQELKLNKELKGHTDGVRRVLFNNDGTLLASSSDDGTVRFWEVEAGSEKKQLKAKKLLGSASMAFSPNGKYFAYTDADETTFQASIVLFNMETNAQAGAVNTGSGANSLSFSKDGKQLAAGGYGFLTVIDVDGMKPHDFDARQMECMRVAFLQEGKSIIVAVSSDEIQIWDSTTQKKKKRISQEFAADLALSPDGKSIAIAAGQCKILNAESGKEMSTFKGPERTFAVACSADGKLLAAGDDTGTIWIYETKSKKQLGKVKGHKAIVLGLAFSPNGKLLASAAAEKDHDVKIWDVPSGKP